MVCFLTFPLSRLINTKTFGSLRISLLQLKLKTDDIGGQGSQNPGSSFLQKQLQTPPAAQQQCQLHALWPLYSCGPHGPRLSRCLDISEPAQSPIPALHPLRSEVNSDSTPKTLLKAKFTPLKMYLPSSLRFHSH
jgi:hypothetical protein